MIELGSLLIAFRILDRIETVECALVFVFVFVLCKWGLIRLLAFFHRMVSLFHLLIFIQIERRTSSKQHHAVLPPRVRNTSSEDSRGRTCARGPCLDG
jgi:hypothetical protein